MARRSIVASSMSGVPWSAKVAAGLTAAASATAAYVAVAAWHGAPFVLGVAGMLGVAAFGLTRRSLGAQIASRGAAYIVMSPLMLGVLARLASGHVPNPLYAGSALALAAALVLARPMLHTREARAEFAPARFRSVFLAGATATMTAAIGAAIYAVAGIGWGAPIMIAFNATLAVVLAVAVRGLLAMRTWGVLLGALTSFGLLALAPFYGGANAVTLTLAAAPALLLWAAPLLIAWRRAHEPQLRVADGVGRIPVRVAIDDEPLAVEEDDAELRRDGVRVRRVD